LRGGLKKKTIMYLCCVARGGESNVSLLPWLRCASLARFEENRSAFNCWNYCQNTNMSPSAHESSNVFGPTHTPILTHYASKRSPQSPNYDKTRSSIGSPIHNLEEQSNDHCEQALILSTVSILPTLPPGPTQIPDRKRSWYAHRSEQLDSNQVPPEHTYSEPGSSGTLTK
jgi:hypothetical protein